jgi:hypothetical protein
MCAQTVFSVCDLFFQQKGSIQVQQLPQKQPHQLQPTSTVSQFGRPCEKEKKHELGEKFQPIKESGPLRVLFLNSLLNLAFRDIFVHIRSVNW